MSSRLGDYDTAQLLLANSADVDALMRDGYTPLHLAVKHEHDDIIKLLLQHSAKLDIKSQVDYSFFPRTVSDWNQGWKIGFGKKFLSVRLGF